MPKSNPPSHAPCGTEDRLLITMKQAASSLSISKRTLDRLIAAGAFPPPLKIGRASRVSLTDIANYLERLRQARGDKLGAS